MSDISSDFGSGYRERTFSQRLSTTACLIVCSVVVAGCGGSSSPAGNRSSPNGNGPAPASVSLSASSTLVSAGTPVTLTWSSSNADSCTASGGWSGGRGLSGSETVGPVTEETTYTLSCSGAGGGGVQQVTVRVDPGAGVSVTLTASPEYVSAGGSTTLSWDTQGASSCTAGDGWSGSRSTSGSFTAGSIDATTTFSLNCDGPGGNGLGMVTVQVVDKVLRWQAPTENIDGTPLTDLAGYVIYWGTVSRTYTGSQTINSPVTTQWEATVPAGRYYFAMTAFDSDNNESGYSNEVLKVIPE